MDVESLVVSLGLDPGEFERGINRVQSAASEGGERLANNLLGPLKTAFAGLVAGFGFKQMLDQFVAQADAVGKFADSIGADVVAVQAWGEAAARAGGSAQAFQSSLRSLNSSMAMLANTGQGRAKYAFDALGISATDASGKMKESFDILLELADKAESMGKAEFMGLAQRLGLDQGTIMLLQSGRQAVEDLIARQKDLGVYTKEDTEIAAVFNDAVSDLQQVLKSIASLIMRMVVPALSAITNKIVDFAAFLRKHEKFVQAFFITLSTILLIQAIPAMAAFAVATWTAIAPLLPFIALIAGLALVIEDLLVYMDGGESALADFWAVFGTGEEIAQSLMDVWEELKATWQAVCEFFAPMFEKAWGRLKGAIDPIAHMFKALFASLRALLQGDIGAAIDYLMIAVQNAIHALVAFFKAQFGLLVDIAKAALGNIFGGLIDWVKGVISDAASIPVVSSFIPDSLLEWAGQEAKPEEKPQPGLAASSERGGGPRMPQAELEQERVGPRSRRGDFDYQFEDEEDSGPGALSQMMQRAAAVIPGAEGATADAVPPAANVSNQQTDISNNMTINGITINTQATDAQGVAAGLQGAISGQMGGIFAAEGGVRR